MIPQQHHALAERLLAQADTWMDADTGWRARLSTAERLAHRAADLATAQVHATLATLLPILTPEPDPAPGGELAVYRAQFESITLGHYTSPEAARSHCEALLLREWPSLSCTWAEDDEDGIAELIAVYEDGTESTTAYTVTPLSVAAAYDAEADE
ncbi:hypothetical protein [Streptomyces sp. NPDC053541]|uniref:hypothetical protein n=1 Tax=Streptomyces sp. NPDC053541 TaxID=3365709 RepID=UPI0037D6EE88